MESIASFIFLMTNFISCGLASFKVDFLNSSVATLSLAIKIQSAFKFCIHEKPPVHEVIGDQLSIKVSYCLLLKNLRLHFLKFLLILNYNI